MAPSTETITIMPADAGDDDAAADTYSISSFHSASQREFDRSSRTEIVHALFGESVGSCWGDFSCNYNRQRGRLYCNDSTVCFFSNLFGFERRICIAYSNVKSIYLYRTTSICITTKDHDEEHIFKSFRDRMVVLELLNQFHRGTSNINSLNDEKDEPELTEEMDSEEDQDYGSEQEVVEKEDQALGSVPSGEEQEETDLNQSSASSRRDSELREDETGPEDVREAWELVKRDSEANYKDVAIDNLSLPCSADEFFALFLANDARHSIPDYQREHIGDSDIEVTHWKPEDEGKAVDKSHGIWLQRSIKCRHKLPKSLGMGPSSALATRNQRLRRFEDIGLCLQSRTHVRGVPASDTFHVDEKWIIESKGETSVSLTVHYEIRFTGRTMFKRMIQSNSSKELHNWYEGFKEMLENSLHAKEGKELAREKEEVSVTMQGIILPQFAFILLFVAVAFLVIHSIILQLRLSAIQDELRLLREDFSGRRR